jgi:hypothetical protein
VILPTLLPAAMTAQQSWRIFMDNLTSTTTIRTHYRVKEFVQLPEFSFLTEGALRHLIFYSQPRYSASGEMLPGNGLDEAGAILRMGRNILIDAGRFRQWMLSSRTTGNTPQCD